MKIKKRLALVIALIGMVSIFGHLLIWQLAPGIFLLEPVQEPEVRIVEVNPQRYRKPEYDSHLRRDIRKSNKNIDDDLGTPGPVITGEDLPIDELETPDSNPKGRQEAHSAIELQAEGWDATFGVGGGGGRFGGSRKSARRIGGGSFGGSQAPAGVSQTKPRAPRQQIRFARVSPPGTVRPAGDDTGNIGSEQYEFQNDNDFKLVSRAPLSTFAIDVDRASYSNIRRFIRENRLPPKSAVRIEEMINYFTYNYPQPVNDQPLAVHAEMADCPWNRENYLVHVGLQARSIPAQQIPSSNIVLLLDVSGSMSANNKLPLLQKSIRMLVNRMRSRDRVAIVTFSSDARVRLHSTSGADKDTIRAAVNRLSAGGSTAGASGLEMAYKIAKMNFIEEGNNRVILATDGDFNVGDSCDDQLVKLITGMRDEGVFLSILGFGTGNYKDAKMEKVADRGNGNYHYIDGLLEAEKVLVKEMGSTILTIAKDVKVQIEFNPARVRAYRLIGYINRKLEAQDFNDDRKDAGEVGAGHAVTALYEIQPIGWTPGEPRIDRLRYQPELTIPAEVPEEPMAEEVMFVKLRYKEPMASRSRRMEVVVKGHADEFMAASEDYRFAAAVAGFGMLLRDSQAKGHLSFEQVIAIARQAKGSDTDGYRSEFIDLVDTCRLLAQQ